MLCCKTVLCLFYSLKCKYLSWAFSRQECHSALSHRFGQSSVLCSEGNRALGFTMNSPKLYLHKSWNWIIQTWFKNIVSRTFLQCRVTCVSRTANVCGACLSCWFSFLFICLPHSILMELLTCHIVLAGCREGMSLPYPSRVSGSRQSSSLREARQPGEGCAVGENISVFQQHTYQGE